MDAQSEFNSTYWMTVAQLVPVLALALVFEARALARRWTRKSNNLPLWWRATVAVLLGVVGYGLVNLEIIAIENLREQTSNEWHYGLVVVAVLAGMFAVVTSPLSVLWAIFLIPVFAHVAQTHLVRRRMRAIHNLQNLVREVLPFAAQIQGMRIEELLNLLEARYRIELTRGIQASTSDAVRTSKAVQYEGDLVAYVKESEDRLAKHRTGLAMISRIRAEASDADALTKEEVRAATDSEFDFVSPTMRGALKSFGL